MEKRANNLKNNVYYSSPTIDSDFPMPKIETTEFNFFQDNDADIQRVVDKEENYDPSEHSQKSLNASKKKY